MRKPEQIDEDVDAGRLATVYVLAGPGEFLIERLIRKIVSQSQSRRVNVSAKELSSESVQTEHLMADLFSTARVVHIDHAEVWKPAARKKFLATVAESLSPGIRVVLTLNSPRPSSAKLPASVQSAFFWNPFPSALPRLAEQFLRDHGGKPERGTGDALVARYGNDLRRIDQEAFKLAICTPGGKASPADVEELCPEVGDQKGYRVAETFTSRNRVQALNELEELLQNDSPHALVATVAGRLRRMRALKKLMRGSPAGAKDALRAAEEIAAGEKRAASGGFGLRADRRRSLEAEVAELLEGFGEKERGDFGDVFPRALPKLVMHASRYKMEELATALCAVAAADRRLKGEASDERLVVTELLLSL